MYLQSQKIAARSSIRDGVRVPLFAVIFSYLLSGQALASRDPIGRSLDWHIYVQLTLFLISLCTMAILWARNGRIPRPSPYLWLFVAFGLLALLSSVRSFWPALSMVKGCLFLLVLLLGELLCNTFSPASALRAMYYGIIVLFVVAILMGLAMPTIYPLIVHDAAGRQRLALFTDEFGDFAYLSGMGFFIGRLSAVRARWYSQAFLAILTVASGSRACTFALIFIFIAVRLRRVRDFRLIVAVYATGAAVVLIAIVFLNSSSAFASSIHNRLQAFYGTTALQQSPWKLSGRAELWDAAAGIFRQSIFLGFGFAGARDQLLRIFPWAGGAHNAFLELLLTAGGAGLLVFLAGLILVIRTSFRSTAGRTALPIYCFLLLVATTGHSFTMFKDFGVLLIICIQHWNYRLAIQQRGTAATRCA